MKCIVFLISLVENEHLVYTYLILYLAASVLFPGYRFLEVLILQRIIIYYTYKIIIKCKRA